MVARDRAPTAFQNVDATSGDEPVARPEHLTRS
jgi:hypothetical protein